MPVSSWDTGFFEGVRGGEGRHFRTISSGGADIVAGRALLGFRLAGAKERCPVFGEGRGRWRTGAGFYAARPLIGRAAGREDEGGQTGGSWGRGGKGGGGERLARIVFRAVRA